VESKYHLDVDEKFVDLHFIVLVRLWMLEKLDHPIKQLIADAGQGILCPVAL
jgi:hypothetical protein